jgi:hypothetical protein
VLSSASCLADLARPWSVVCRITMSEYVGDQRNCAQSDVNLGGGGDGTKHGETLGAGTRVLSDVREGD